MRIVVLLACLFALTVMPVCQLQAQEMSSIEGVVRDAAGNPVANVPVTLVNPVTGTQTTEVTGPNGFYRFDNVPAGRYTIRIAGRQVTPGVTPPPAYEREYQVTAPGPVRAEIALTPVPLTDLLTAQAVPIEMAPAQIRNAFTAPQSEYLPTSNLMEKGGDEYGALNLSLLTEAVVTAVGNARGPSVAGGDPIHNTFRINGIDNNNKIYPGPLSYVSNMATEQFTLFAAQHSPVFGHASGGNFLTNTGVGANRVHGSAYYYYNDDVLNAEDNWERSVLPDADRSFTQYRLGGSIGFPIVPSKISGYGNFEWIPTRYTSPLSGFMYAPTPAGFSTLAGIPGVSSTNLGILQTSIGGFPVLAPTRTTTVAGRTIPLGLVAGTYNNNQKQYMGTGALEFVPNTTNSVNLRYVHNELNADPFASSPTFPIANEMDSRALNAVANWTHVFTPNIYNDLRGGYNRYRQSFSGDSGTSFPGFPAFPNIQIGGASSLLLGPQTGLFETSAFNTYQLADNVSWVVGPHQFQFGGDAMRYISSIRNLNAFRGNFVYSGLDRYLLDLPPDVLAQEAFGNSSINDNRWLFSGWLHDNWRAAPNFNLLLGVRYQYATLPRFVTGKDLFEGENFEAPLSETTNFSPHVGIAWAPAGQTNFVIRGNFSMMYDNLYSPYTYFRLGQVLPQLGTTVTATSLSSTPGFLAGGGIPNPYTVPPADITPAQAAALTSVVATDQDTPYVMRWDAAVQTRLWERASLTLKYLGTRGVNQPLVESLSGPAPALAGTFPLFFSQPSAATLNSLDLTLNEIQAAQEDGIIPVTAAHGTPSGPVFIPSSSVLTVNNAGLSRYNAGSAVFNQRFASGATFYATYTYSHLTSDYTGTVLDPLFGRNEAQSLFDRTHRVTGLLMFDLGAVTKTWTGTGWASHILADFNVSANYIYQSGAPVPALEGINPGLLGLSTFRTPIYTAASLTGGAGTPLTNSSGQVVGILATPPAGLPFGAAPGNSTVIGAPNAFYLDPVNNIDVSFTKRFGFGDIAGLEFRGTAYNVVNHSQFTGVPVNSFGFMNLNSITSFYAPGNSLFTDASRFLTNNARNIQLSARIIF